MTQIFDEKGTSFPVTILKARLCKVSRIRVMGTDGCNAIQLAYDEVKFKNLNKSQQGLLQKLKKVDTLFKLRNPDSTDDVTISMEDLKGFKSFGEFRVSEPEKYKLGQIIGVKTFQKGEKVSVTGTCIGKGFSGNQKRHNFSRGPMTHGSKNHRLPGSIGAGTTPGRVYPGKKMAGRLGGNNVTLTKTEILYINSDENILVVKGSVPGKKNVRLKIQHRKTL
jgi:large subunit ribosomal protein L3